MNDFARGVWFTIGMIMFGSGCYGLGKQKERIKNIKQWKELQKNLDEMKERLEAEMHKGVQKEEG